MISRRTFLQKTAALSSFALVNDAFISDNPKRKKIISIATWANNTKATQVAWDILSQGGYALDAVEKAIHVPESDPDDTSVGYGGNPDRDGIVTLDACIMDEKGNAGSVTFLQNIMHPISVARLVMEKTPHVLLSGEGALRFALEQGFKKENLLTEKAKESWLNWLKESKYKPVISSQMHDTIGLIAVDKNNNVCGGCSTSGAAYKMHGRVGDSPIFGAGLFVDNEVGAATCTGLGEMMLKNLSSFLIVELMRQGKHPQKACEEAVKRLAKKCGTEHQAGLVAVDKKGNYGAFSLLPNFDYALCIDGNNQKMKSNSYIS
jgi:isoaspartyl peptidase/L-asparaginase-like protein (Ntn-hydrolase superfamily)